MILILLFYYSYYLEVQYFSSTAFLIMFNNFLFLIILVHTYCILSSILITETTFSLPDNFLILTPCVLRPATLISFTAHRIMLPLSVDKIISSVCRTRPLTAISGLHFVPMRDNLTFGINESQKFIRLDLNQKDFENEEGTGILSTSA